MYVYLPYCAVVVCIMFTVVISTSHDTYYCVISHNTLENGFTRDLNVMKQHRKVLVFHINFVIKFSSLCIYLRCVSS